MKRFGVIFWVLVTLFVLSFLSAKIIGTDEGVVGSGIGLIRIAGPITVEGGDSVLGRGASSTKVIENIEKASKNSGIKVIIFEINSPGGTVVASREIAHAVKKLNKPTVAWIREVGASGAYWIASSTDRIVADRLSITGSIGVTSSYLEFTGLMDKYGIGYEKLAAGEFKELGNPFAQLTAKEKQILQKKIDRIQEVFIEEIAENRGLTDSQKRAVKSGLFYLGEEALELNLIDVLGNKDTAIDVAKKLADLKDGNIVEYKEKKSIFDFLNKIAKSSAYYMGKGMGAELKVNREISIRA